MEPTLNFAQKFVPGFREVPGTAIPERDNKDLYDVSLSEI